MNEKLKSSIIKKISYFIILLVVLILYSCDLNEQDKVFRRQITLETNLSTLKISDQNGIRNLDSSTVYPYLLNEVYSPNLGGYGIIIYPVLVSGIIKLNIYGGEGYNSQLSFKDSMTIYTPIDTFHVATNSYNFLRY